MRYPGQESAVARGLRRSPLYETLKARGAVYGSKNGWERPNWFAPVGVEPVDRPGFTDQNWKPYVAEEHRAVREGVALIRSEEHTSELQSLMRISYAVFCLEKTTTTKRC